MSSVAIITARGGSKRIPRKNIKEFCGKPIIAYSIEAAVNSGLFDEVMVSTDDKEIAAIAKQYGASIPFMRSEKNSDDYAGTADVLVEVIEEYKELNKEFEWVCCIYPTAPFVTSDKLKQANKIIVDKVLDGLIPVVKFSYPPQRCFVLNNGKLSYKWPQYLKSRSQDLEAFYHDAGQFYFIKSELLLKNKSLLTENIDALVLNEQEVQDIDTIDDWKIAEIKYQLMKA